jgi:amino acid adenylation domain-containing protein
MKTFEAALEAVWPATAVQAGMLFHSTLAPRSGIYCQQVVFSIRGALDAPRFERAWQHATERHPTLRTYFDQNYADGIVQVVRRRVDVPFTYFDWHRVPPGRCRSMSNRYAESDRRRGFDPGVAPLMRISLFRTSEHAYQVLWSYHHALLDGWSLPLVLGDVLGLYSAEVEGSPAPPLPPVKFETYLNWLASRDLADAEAFWRTLLKGFTAPTTLPACRVAAVPSGKTAFAQVRQHLPEAATRSLYQQAKCCGITLGTIIHAAWAMLLSRYSGEDDVLFGQCVSGRTVDIPHVESLTGMLMNTLPTRVRLPRDGAVIDWLREFQKQNIRLRRFEWTPLTHIQTASEVPRPSPLFESIVVLENYPVAESVFSVAGLAISRMSVRGWTNYPLAVTLLPSRNRLSLQLDYARTRFERSDMQRISVQFLDLLTQFTVGFDRRVRGVDLPNAGALLGSHTNCGTQDLPSSFVELFALQARRTPAAAAVVCGNESCSYAELDHRASAAMRVLRRAGASVECVIGICLDRSIELLIWLIGLLKSGAAFVPLPAAWPAQRMQLVLQDARPRFVLTNEWRAALFSELGMPVLAIESAVPDIQPHTAVECVPAATSAYVIYTSGSTGLPKGVQVSHAALAQVLCAVQSLVELSADDEFLALTDLSFDIAMIELLLPLTAGARVRLSALDPAIDTVSLVREADGVTCMQAAPAVWRLLLEAGWQGGGTMKLLCGGDVIPRDLAGRLQKAGGRVWNLYGPTEAVIWCTAHELTHAREKRPIPIGTPLPHARVYILDRSGRPVAPGVSGQLHIGGTALARGYLNQPALTAQQFHPDPFGNVPGGRLYASGDIARQLPNGDLEFIGRADTQVKIRGMRVNLMEIEAVLQQHPSIRQAAVTTCDGVLLAAYTPTEDHSTLDAHDLRDFVAERLPSQMLPARFMRLDALPLTVGGKLDRRAIASLLALTPRQYHNTVSNEPESVLAKACQEVLGLSACPEDDFFALGGDSIKCLQLLAKLRDLGFHLTAREVFNHPRLSDLARLARRVEKLVGAGKHTSPGGESCE